MCSFDSVDSFVTCTFAEKPMGAYTVRSLKKGTSLYRADSTGKILASPEMPLFLTDRETLRPYLRGTSETFSVSKQTLSKKIKLFEVTLDNLGTLLDDPRLTANDLLFLMNFIGRTEVTDALSRRLSLPVGSSFVQIWPAMQVATPEKTQGNRQFADLVCRLGFTGWIVPPNSNVFQKNLNIREFQRGHVQFDFNYLAPEIVLCKWTEVAKGSLEL